MYTRNILKLKLNWNEQNNWVASFITNKKKFNRFIWYEIYNGLKNFGKIKIQANKKC